MNNETATVQPSPDRLPLRPGLDVAQSIESINTEPETTLSPEQRANTLIFERDLTRGELQLENGEQIEALEPLWKLDVKQYNFHLDFFLTEEGRQSLALHTGNAEIPEFGSIDDARLFLANTQFNEISDISGFASTDKAKKFLREKTDKEVDGEFGSMTELESYLGEEGEDLLDGLRVLSMSSLSGASRKYGFDGVAEQFANSGYSSIDNVDNPTNFNLVFDPEIVERKLVGLTKLKQYHKEQARSLDSGQPEDKARSTILDIHIDRTNELLAETYSNAMSLAIQAEYSLAEGPAASSIDRLRHQLGESRVFLNPTNHTGKASSFDKYIIGVDKQLGADGNFSQISSAALESADSNNRVETQMEPGRYQISDIEGITVDSNEQIELFESMLAELGLLSEHPFDVSASSQPEDGLWNVGVDPSVGNLSVRGHINGIVVSPDFNRTMHNILPAGAAPVAVHEMTHVLQNHNTRLLGLSIAENVGFARSNAEREGGAISQESIAQAELFGQDRPTNPHYLRAAQARLAGGDYRTCMQAFFDSMMDQNPGMDPKKAANQAKTRAARLFRGAEYDDVSSNLARSEALSYLEQALVVNELRKYKMEHLLTVGVPLNVLAGLRKSDILSDGVMNQMILEVPMGPVIDFIDQKLV